MGKLRIYYQILGTKPFHKEVSSPEEAKAVIDGIADFVNQKVDERVFPNHCSAAGLEYWDEEEQEWLTWYDDEGYDFFKHFEVMNDEI